MDKLELLKKLKALATDNRGNSNERESAEQRLNELMTKYGITNDDIELEIRKRRDFYFRELWEHKLICQTLYKIVPEASVYRYKNKRNWLHCELTDAEYLEFEMYYPAYKASFQKEFDLFYSAFVAKNNIYPKDTPKQTDATDIKNKYSRGELMRISMMAEGIESTRVHRQIGDGNNGTN